MKTFLFFLFWGFGMLMADVEITEGMSMEQFRAFLAKDPYKLDRLPAFAARVPDEKEPVWQAHYMATCYLGYLAKGEHQTALLAYASLKETHPESLYIERLAPERLVHACPDCRRVAQTRVVCAVCKATNVCQQCKGRKTMEGLNGKRNCPKCQGTGHCTFCDRKGYVTAVTCPTCNNTRKVLNKNKVMHCYKRMLLAEEKEVRSKHGVRFFYGRPGDQQVQETEEN